MRTLAFPLALVIIVLAPVVVIGLVAGLEQWARWLVQVGGAWGIAGVLLTGVAVGNLLVPRTCATEPVEEVNRPLVSVAVGDGSCYRAGIAQLQLAALAGVGASVAVLLRPSARDGGARPGVRYR